MFLGCKGHTWAVTIEKSKKNYQVWSQKGSTFFLSTKCHILAKSPVLGNLTHMCSIFVFICVIGELRELCANFGNFWINIHRKIICQSWLLLTPFYNGPIVHWLNAALRWLNQASQSAGLADSQVLALAECRPWSPIQASPLCMSPVTNHQSLLFSRIYQVGLAASQFTLIRQIYKPSPLQSLTPNSDFTSACHQILMSNHQSPDSAICQQALQLILTLKPFFLYTMMTWFKHYVQQSQIARYQLPVTDPFLEYLTWIL